MKHPEEEISQIRYQELLEIQQQISLQNNEKLRGKVLKVLIDENDPKHRTAVGRTYADSPEIDNEVILENVEQDIEIGKLYQTKIINAAEYEIFGQIVEKK